MLKALKNSARFLLLVILSFFIFYFILSYFSNEFNLLAAKTGSWLLNGVGLSSYTIDNIIYADSSAAIISGLCNAVFEISLLTAFIISTLELELRKRIKWIFIAIISILIVNPIRIAISILILNENNTQTFILSHDLLFRIMTFSTIILIYALFTSYSKKSKK